MKVYQEEDAKGLPKSFVLILDKKEARTLVEIVETAHKADKRRSTFRRWKKKIEDCLCCF